MGGISRRARRQALRSAGLTAAGGEVNVLGMVKLSDILLHVAHPLLRDLKMPEQVELFRRALALGALLWNASRAATEEEREEWLREVLDLPGEPLEPEVEALLRQTFRRARRLHPRDPRLIAETDVRMDENGGFVVSALTFVPLPSGT